MNTKTELNISGIFTYEHVRDGKVIDTWTEENKVVDEGLTYVLANSLDGSTSSIANWYIGLFKNNYTVLNTTNAANIVGDANESQTDYSEIGRPAWVEAGVNALSITNAASVAQYTFTAVSTLIYGAFLVSNATKGATTGTLLSASQFGASRTMLQNDILNVTYELTIASST